MSFTDRTSILLGDNAINKLKKSHVAVFGVGGVGGYVAEMLVRSGVGTLSIVDFDKVTETNINRQIIALQSTIGKLKVDVFKNRLKDINPNIVLNVFPIKFCEENLNEIFSSDFDYVVDAIDDVKNKLLLIKTCKDKNIKIVSAMGAGNRSDIPKFEVNDIYKTYNDGLAKVMRKKLRELNIDSLDVVSTTSQAISKEKIVGSIAYYPAMCGCTISAFVVNKLIEEID